MMGMLDEPLGLVPVPYPDPEAMTATRLKANAAFAGDLPPMPPSQKELDWYAREGKTPPTA